MPQASAVLLREGECVLPSSVGYSTGYAPPRLDGCALDIVGPNGLCPYCGAPPGEHRTPTP